MPRVITRALHEAWSALVCLGFAYSPIAPPIDWIQHTNATIRKEAEARLAARRARHAPPPWHPEAGPVESRFAAHDEPA